MKYFLTTAIIITCILISIPLIKGVFAIIGGAFAIVGILFSAIKWIIIIAIIAIIVKIFFK